MNKALLALALLAVSLGGCQRGSAPPPLAGARIGGPFLLTDQDGRSYSSERLKGRYAIVYFGYTFCPDVCPMDMAVLGKGLKAFEARDPARAARVQPVFITVDPERDTPAVLKQYVAAFHPRLIGLTGSAATIAAVEKAYAAIGQKQAPVKGATGYLVQHSRMATLFGPDGAPIALVPVDADAAQVTDTLATWVR
jgi:protein SCO1/2